MFMKSYYYGRIKRNTIGSACKSQAFILTCPFVTNSGIWEFISYFAVFVQLPAFLNSIQNLVKLTDKGKSSHRTNLFTFFLWIYVCVCCWLGDFYDCKDFGISSASGVHWPGNRVVALSNWNQEHICSFDHMFCTYPTDQMFESNHDSING